MCAISSLTSTFAISSPDEFLLIVAEAGIDYTLLIMSTALAASAAVIILLMCLMCVKRRQRTGN